MKEAKALLTGSTCDNCFFNKLYFKPITVFCIRHEEYHFKFPHKNTCDEFYDTEEGESIITMKELSKVITQGDVNRLIELVNEKRSS